MENQELIEIYFSPHIRKVKYDKDWILSGCSWYTPYVPLTSTPVVLDSNYNAMTYQGKNLHDVLDFPYEVKK